jgi:hypothetical protein
MNLVAESDKKRLTRPALVQCFVTGDGRCLMKMSPVNDGDEEGVESGGSRVDLVEAFKPWF